jgi:very-short-patch-repair endonuclease
MTCGALGLPCPHPEYRFHEQRKFRFDWAWPDRKVALEEDGGVWTRGRHTRGAGFLRDMEKLNLAVELGWRVLRYQTGHVDFEQLRRVLG